MRFWRKRVAPNDGDGDTLAPDVAAWPFNADSPVVAGIARPDRPLSVMLVDMTGLDWPEIAPLLDTARTASAARGMVPVLIVDLTDFAGLCGAGFAYDVLPNAAANAGLLTGLDWPAYLARRRRLLAEKWQPAAIVHLSQHAEGWE